jgi:hypothetical protein
MYLVAHTIGVILFDLDYTTFPYQRSVAVILGG